MEDRPRPPPPIMAGTDWPLLAVAVLSAVSLRVVWIAHVNVDPNDGRFADTVFFHNVAHLLATGAGYVEPYGRVPTAQWPPGYAAALAVLYKLFGWHLILAKGLNIAFAAVTVAVTYVIGRRIFDRRVAYLGALILAFFPGQIYFSTLVQTATMFAMAFMVVLLLALVWTIQRPEARWWQLLLIGFLIGVAAMVRVEGVILIFVLVAVWALTVRPWRTVARYAVLAAVGTALALTPWTVRNAIQLHEFIPLRPGAARAVSHALDPEAERALILLDPGAGLRFSVAEGLRYQLSHPWEAPGWFSRRIARFYHNDSDGIRFILSNRGPFVVDYLPEDDSDGVRLVLRRRTVIDDANYQPLLTEQEEARWRVLADRYFFAAGAAALVAAVLCVFRRERSWLLLIMAVAGWTAFFGFLPPSTRFHFALGPVISVLAGAFFVFAWDGAWAAWRKLSAAGWLRP